MSVQESTSEEPRTRSCRRCAVEINAGSARCPFCGARQFKRQPILSRWGALLCLVLVAAAVVVTREIVIERPHHYFAFFRGSNLAALVPAGYQDLHLTAPHGTAIAGWADPAQPQDSETVQATIPATASPTARLRALAAKLANTPGVSVSYRGPVDVVFPGGLVVPELEYTTHLGPTAVFAFEACAHTVAVTVTISSTSRTRLDGLSGVLPQSANALCHGPAFSNQNRADVATPLSVPR
jgi:RNA polymerase subunit RPABC4/transcription elongation factor Spt4